MVVPPRFAEDDPQEDLLAFDASHVDAASGAAPCRALAFSGTPGTSPA